jgi:hypothetical protein
MVTAITGLLLITTRTSLKPRINYMPGVDRTTDFHELLTQKRNAIPEAKRRKITKYAKSDPPGESQNLLGKEYLAEAYVIVCICPLDFSVSHCLSRYPT